eukprot:9022065-Pyramimonas_sp.AAC.1
MGALSKRSREPCIMSSAKQHRQQLGSGRAQESARTTGSRARANIDPEAGHPCYIPDEITDPGKRHPERIKVTAIP